MMQKKFIFSMVQHHLVNQDLLYI